MDNIHYYVKSCEEALRDEKFRKECIHLYSGNYGVWGKYAHTQQVGRPVQLSDSLFQQWLSNQHVSMYYAKHLERIVGYAVVLQTDVEDYGIVTWVTQLVVHKNYRNQGIAKQILLSAWGFSDHHVWGIVTANPYAIRALEKVTRRRVVPGRIMQEESVLREFACKYISYINRETEFEIDEQTSKVNTEFFVDHTDVPQQMHNVTNETVPWLLGEIDEGWEWFAFTFRDQKVMDLQTEEIERFLETSDSIVKNAYARMKLQSKEQKWAQHTIEEVDYILQHVDVPPDAKVYDLGCGQGRHSIELARRGFDVTGIDYVESHIVQAKENITDAECKKIELLCSDCRNYTNETKADLVVCLYDVVGSFADMKSNMDIIRSAYDLLKPGGRFVLSVMNYELTCNQAKSSFVFKEEPNEIFSIKPSKTMETTGNVFDPEYYLVDREEHVVYRKEQFSLGDGYLPSEFLVRDRRFTQKEIEGLCLGAGFIDVKSKFINAASWESQYEATDSKAKEILVICTK